MVRAKRASLSVAVITTVVLSYAIPAYAVRDGGPSSGNAIFMYAAYTDGSNDPGAFGTAGSIRPRCLITANHVLSGVGPNGTVFGGSDLQVITNNSKRQKVARSTAVEGAKSLWADIAVLWTENKKDDTIKRLQSADFATIPLKKAEDFDIPSTGKTIRLVGYGVSETVGGVDGGDKVKRWGNPKAVLHYYGSSQTPKEIGSIIGVEPRAADNNRMACAGDSGAPLQNETGASGFYGVLASAGGGGLCKDVETNTFTAFDDTNAQGGKTNWVRVNEAVKKTCGKTVTGLKTGAAGRVEGVLTGYDPSFPLPGNSYNTTIAYGEGVTIPDQVEFMHDGETMTLTAIPDAGSVFKKWLPSPYQGNCPCLDSTNPVCEIGYEDIGVYTETESIDEGGCMAEFGYEDSSSSSSLASSDGSASSVPSSSASSEMTSSSAASSAYSSEMSSSSMYSSSEMYSSSSESYSTSSAYSSEMTSSSEMYSSSSESYSSSSESSSSYGFWGWFF